MSFVEGLKNIGADANPDYLGVWPHKLGSFILNFANLELITYQYLNSLEATEKEFDENIGKFLSQRIDRVLYLIEESNELGIDVKEEMSKHWNRVKELSKWRNRIAHNPVLPTWKSSRDSNNSPPDVLGIPDMKQIKTNRTSDSLSLEAMDALINDTFGLGNRLLKLMKNEDT